MHEDHLLDLTDRFPGCSWAIWSDAFPNEGCPEEGPEQLVDFMCSRVDHLTPEVVFVSLNPSSEQPTDFSNFHSPLGKHYDDRLKRFIQGHGLQNLIGGYMTDIVPQVIDPDSGNVDPDDADVESFLKELAVLDQPSYHIICFTGKTFEALRRYCSGEVSTGPHSIERFTAEVDGRMLHVYRVWFYGLYGVHQDKMAELEKQLAYLNNEVIDSSE